MIWGLKLCILCKKTVDMSLRGSIHTGTVFFGRKPPRTVRYEPGLRNLKKIEEPNTKFSQEFDDEHDLDDDFDFSKMNEAYNLHQWEQKKEKSRTQFKIISKKYFAPRPQPPMLTWNERQYIKFLHNEDPIQWNLKCLSESFPATPDTIKKILKSKMKISPERAKSLDLKVQKNWELLAEGKLDADPHVLEHFKKFSNKREVLLEQVKNMKFYLPEIKKEPVWNHGEMNQILVHYDKAINKLMAQAKEGQNSKALSSGVSEENSLRKKEKSNLDLINEDVKMQINKTPELKDSFIYGEVIDAFKKNITLEELENKLLQKTEKKEKLEVTEKAILESMLGIYNSENFSKNNINHNVQKFLTTNEREENMQKNLNSENKIRMKFDKKFVDNNIITKKMKSNTSVSFHNETHFTNETGISKLLTDISLKETEVTETKPKTVISDSVKLQNEKAHYDQEVLDVKNTAFWHNNMRSKERKMLEFEKRSLELPEYSDEKMSKTSSLNNNIYPQRIKIPRNKWRSGLTFRIKDCYYDDDGEFLYRVPGMTK